MSAEQCISKHNSPYSVAFDVIGFKIFFVNVYMIGEPINGGDWILIDAGLPGSADRIRKEAEKVFGSNNKPRAIVRTHGHFDHVGALPKLLSYWDVPVYAHPLEMPYLRGKSHYPPPLRHKDVTVSYLLAKTVQCSNSAGLKMDQQLT
ncbi:MBL fold metallo-hydrolase [Fulvivirga sp. 29W222]|uniref:MBL fold metallo-hydrolase n=1 Tax=Fulvivirga marina TaxID=2494733 RepID=A0A937G3H7_9BACT|nr:MBL fold metallo-hydrolase [Fulvivirga marina]MBL6447761.1 MBL fold metallo-hydrolase [Fulvivirga marina]